MPAVFYRRPPRWRGFGYYLRCKLTGRPPLVNLEFTKHCNAKCGFCACWQVKSPNELTDYAPVIRRLRPVVVSVSGGEPLLRKNYAELLKGMRPYCHYLMLITNGALLNETSADALVDAGVDQISVSLDHIGKQQDEERFIEGLYDHIAKTVPILTKKGYNVVLNTVIKNSNLDEIIPLTHKAAEWGAKISFSAYCPLKKDDREPMIRHEHYTQLVNLIEELKRLKSTMRHIKSSVYYLDRLPRYFRDGGIGNCHAGFRWLQVTPDGYIQQCSELPRVAHYALFSRRMIKKPACTKCWYSCRGESEASPLAPRRLLELVRN